MHKNYSIILFCIFLCISTVSAQKDTIGLNEVVVTGTRAVINRNNIPMTISVVDRNTIEESGESALLSVLSEQIPGMFITERGVTGFGVSTGGSGGISMRGIGGSPTTEVLVLIDGHPQYMGIMGHHLPDAYLASDVDKVEVVRGPASILYGSNAMGGAINIITRKQDKEGWNANTRLMYGSYNTQKYMANAGLKKGKYDGFLSVNHDRTDGHRDNSDFHITNGYARSGYTFSEKIRLWGDASIAAYKAQNPGTKLAPMIDNVADITRGVASATLENNLGKSSGALKLFYNFGKHEINDGYASGATPRDYLFNSKDYNLGATLYQNFNPFAGNILTAGIDYKFYGGHAWNDSIGNKPDQELVDKSNYELAGYLVVQQTLFDKLTLNGGIRLDYNKIFGSEWVPQIGLAYQPLQGTVIKGSVAKGFRSPTIRELYYKAAWAAANPDLKPERMVNYEVSLEQKFFDGQLLTELTGFIADGSNIIEVEQIAGRRISKNTGNFLNKGIELSVKWHVLKQLHIHGNYSYLNSDKKVLYAPRHKAFVSANYRLQKWGLNAGYQFIDKLRNSATNTTSYGILNAKVSYRPVKYLDIFVKGENLTAKQYEIMQGYSMPKFTMLGGINVSLGNI